MSEPRAVHKQLGGKGKWATISYMVLKRWIERKAGMVPVKALALSVRVFRSKVVRKAGSVPDIALLPRDKDLMLVSRDICRGMLPARLLFCRLL